MPLVLEAAAHESSSLPLAVRHGRSFIPRYPVSTQFNMPSMQDELLYTPLPQGTFIRCLVLEPGHGSMSLKCRLETVNLSANPPPSYDAISYVWGSNEKTEGILCNSTTTMITTNLSKALKSARHKLEPRILWADSLCINQTNDEEKGHQVALMGQIYSQASRVLVHIVGDDQGHASKLATLIQERNVVIEHELSRTTAPGTFPRLQPEDKAKMMVDGRWESLHCFLSQPWFSRGWVVQEAALACQGHAIILWGKEEIIWDSFLRCMMWLMCRCPEVLASCWNKVYIHCELYGQRHRHEVKAYGYDSSAQGLDLSLVLATARCLTFADPRDRVFAFLSLENYGQLHGDTSLRTSRQIEPDYTKSTEEVYVGFAERQILYGDIRILHFAAGCGRDDETAARSMPSWAPRWNIASELHVRSDLWKTEPLRPSPGFSGTIVREVRNSTGLLVTGVIFDHIRHHSDGLKPNMTVFDLAVLWNIVDSMKLAEAYQPEQQAMAMIQCLCRGQAPPEMSRSAWAAKQEALAQLLENANDYTLGEARNEIFGLDIIPKYIEFWSAGRSLVSTGRGLLGNGPGSVVAGDICCIIFGCATPFVLRLVPGCSREDRAHYRIVGDAWIGVIDGDGVIQPAMTSEHSNDWDTWGLKEQEIFIV